MNRQRHGILSMHDPRLHAPFLRHPSICQHQQLVAGLQQTSKELHAAVAARLAGQLPVVLDTKRLQQTQHLVQWLSKHAGLLQSLELQVPRRFCALGCTCWAAGTAAAMESALQQAAGSSTLQLQSFVLAGSTSGSCLLQQLPAARLNKLCVDVDFSISPSLQAVAGLTGLQHLDLVNVAEAATTTAAAIIPDDVLAPLAAGLQQLTQLHVGPVRPAQLQWLPPKLQQLHVTVELCNQPQQLLQLASWLQQHASIVRSLKLQGGRRCMLEPGWDAATAALTGAFQAAADGGAAPPPPAAAAGATPGLVAPAQSLQLQSLCGRLVGPVPEQLPVSTLTELAWRLDWRRTAEVSKLCSLTALQKLDILSAPSFMHWKAHDFAPLSALQWLTSLQLGYARRRQLEHLRVPLLLELTITLHGLGQGVAVQLQMGHLTSLTKLKMLHWAASTQLEDTLPLGLQELEFEVFGGSTVLCRPRGSPSIQAPLRLEPLLQLHKLRKLQLRFSGVPGAPEEAVQQLSRLTSLQELHVTFRDGLTRNKAVSHGEAAATLSAFLGLPLKSLSWSSIDIPIAVIEQVGHLHGLTSFELSTEVGIPNFQGTCSGAGLQATPGQLAAILRPLTELRQLHLRVCSRVFVADEASNGSDPCSGSGSDATTVGHSAAVVDDVEGVAALLRCVGGLREVEALDMSLLVRLPGSDVQLLQGMLQQLLPSYMLPYCKVQADKISIYL